jgi:citrate lyase subunit beta/citryl-CoA lyase
MVARAVRLPADMVFVDMEDSVAAADRGEPARAAARAALDRDFAAPTVGLRVNPPDSPWCLRDLTEVVGPMAHRLDVVLVPKVEDPGDVAFVCRVVDALEEEAGLERCRIGVEVQIESPHALLRAPAIGAACPPRVEAFVFGPGDFAASLGAPQTMVGEVGEDGGWDPGAHALFAMVAAARAHGLQAVDGPWGSPDDADGLRRAARRALALGCDGKWSIHPDQIPVLHEVFTPGAAEVARAHRILDALRGVGAARMGGEMVDEATRRLAEGVLRRAGDPGAAGGDRLP